MMPTVQVTRLPITPRLKTNTTHTTIIRLGIQVITDLLTPATMGTGMDTTDLDSMVTMGEEDMVTGVVMDIIRNE
jgi:hypothetical protein